MTLRLAWTCVEYQCYFAIENPFPSWLWLMPEVLRLVYQGGRRSIPTLSTLQSYGAPWYKLTGAVHNIPLLHLLDIGEMAELAKISLRGFLPSGEALTSFASPYPPKWAEQAGKFVKGSMDMRRIAIDAGLPVPMADWTQHFDYIDRFDIYQWLGQNDNDRLWYDEDKWGLVPWGGGAARGLTQEEHVMYAKSITHPMEKKEPADLDETSWRLCSTS